MAKKNIAKVDFLGNQIDTTTNNIKKEKIANVNFITGTQEKYIPKDKRGNFFQRSWNTVQDAGLNLMESFLNTTEGWADWISYKGADVLDYFGIISDEYADEWRDAIKRDLISEAFETDKKKEIEQKSYLNKTTRSVVQGTGNVLANIGGGHALGINYGADATKLDVAKSALLSYTSASGNATSEALRNGADYNTAKKVGVINGIAEAISEQFFDAMPGTKAEGWGGKLTGKVGSLVEKYFGTNTGKLVMKTLNASGEGFEEIISNMLVATGNDVAHWLDKNYTYGMDNQTGNVLKDIGRAWTSQESWEAFLSASLTSALTNGASNLISNTQKNNIIKSYAQENNMKVSDVKKMFNQSFQQKAQNEVQMNPNMNLGDRVEIEQKAKVQTLQEMKRGSFVEPGTETDAYKYQETDNEKVNNMNKSLERIGANNDIKTREAAALGGRLARDLGLDIEFTNKQEIEQKIKNGELNPTEGTNINGYVANGKMYLNIDSDQMVNFTVGHETKHFFETNEELNKSLNDALENYAKLKGRYEEDLARVTKTYTDKDGNLVGDPKAELMADYVGEFFTDYDFVSNLSTKNPTLFTKVRDFFQKLYYKATNQKEKLFIKQINDNINKAYREYAKTQPGKDISSAETKLLTQEQQETKQKEENILPITEKVEEKVEEKPKTNKKEFQAIIYSPKSNSPVIANVEGTTSNIEGIDVGIYKDGKNNWHVIDLDSKLSLNTGQESKKTRKAAIESAIKNIQENDIESLRKTQAERYKDIKEDKTLSNKDIQYSLSPKGEMVDNETGEKVELETSDVGNTGTLMAIHNLNESKLKGILELGGFPVPSIAITTTENVGSNQFGDISVLFDKSTIDPAVAENEVYDRDVWSPTFPRVEYDIDNQMLRNLSKENNFYDNNEDDIISNARLNYLYSENLTDLVDRYGIDKTLDQMKNDNKLKYLYLKTMDNNYQPQMKPTKYSYDYSNETLQKYVDMYNQNKFNDMPLPDFYYHYLNYGDMDLTSDQTEALKLTIRDIIYEEYKQQAEQEYEKNIEKGNDLGKYKNNKDGFIENYVNMMLESYDNSYFKYKDFVKAASRLDEFGETQSIDESNTLKKVEEDINQKEYEKWIDDTFGNMLKNAKKGIRNDVDLFTPSGNRRSFDKLHENYDLQSVVRQMIKQKTVAGEEGFGAGSGFGTIQAQMSNQFNTLDEIREYANERIVPGTQEKDLTKPYADAIYSDMEELLEYYKFKDEKYSYPMDTVGYALNEFAGYKKQDLTSLKRALNEYSFNTDSIPNELLNKVVDDVNSLKTLPTDYFEAKPQRAVGLDEIQQVVIPNDVNSEFKKQLQDKGIPYTEYDKTIDGDKQRVINQFDDLKFSLSQQGEDLEQQYQDLYPIKNKVTTRLSDLKKKEVELPTEEENALKTAENEQKQGEKPTRREVIDRNRQLAREQLGDITNIKDKKRGFLYQINTMKRNLRDIMSKEQAQKMYDTYFKDITTNNAKIENEITSYNERIQKYNLNDKESTYTQMIGELKHNPETTLTQEQVDEFYRKNSNKIDQQKCEQAVDEFRNIYDELIEKINDVLTDNGYKPIEYRKGYFPHFIEEKATSKLGKLAEKLGWKVKKGQLPTDVAGITDQFKPGKAWTSFSQQRTGDATDYNALKGLDNYLRGAMDVIYHTNDIQKLRALENEIRYQYSDKGIQEKINEIYADDTLDMEEKNDAIANLTANIRESGLGNFVTEIRNYTDNLANKKSITDRGLEQTFGRDVYSIMNNINGRVSANMVGANISSAITNFIPITQAWGNISTKNLMKGMYESIKTSIKGDDFANRSTFLTNRTKQADRLYNTKLEKINKKLGIPFEAIDSFTANTIVRGKYYDNIAKGMTEQEAMNNADEFAKDVMAGRSKGDQPTMFNKKNPLVKLFTAFQLEVNNQYGYMFKDIPTNLADEAKDKLVGAFIKMFLGAWLYNEISEKFTGRRAAFDPIDMAVTDIKTLTDENMDLGDKIQSIVKDTSQELPFVSGVMGGGRLPIQGAIPYSDPLEMITSTFEDIGKLDDPEKRKTAINNLKKEWSKPVYYLLMPFAGGQIKKTVEGLSMYDKDLPVAGSYTNSGKLRFEADTSPLGKVQAAVFGQYASKNAREYFEKGYTPLTEKQLNTALNADMSANEYREYTKGLKEQKTTEEKVDYIYDLPLSDSQKNVLVNSALTRKDDIDLSNYGDYGSLAEFDYANKNPEKYLTISNITDYDTFQTYKEDISAIKNSYNNTDDRKQAVFEYINSLPLNIEQKLMLQKMAGGYSIKQYRGRMHDYINSLDLTAEEKQSIDDVLFK